MTGQQVPWDTLTERQKEDFWAMLRRMGLDIEVEEAEQYYGNKEKALADLEAGR